MVAHQHWQRVRQASRVKWAVFFLIVLGACSLIPPVFAHPGFTSELVASFADRHNLLKREEKMHAYAARPSFECTSKTGSDHAYFILHAGSACRVFF